MLVVSLEPRHLSEQDFGNLCNFTWQVFTINCMARIGQ